MQPQENSNAEPVKEIVANPQVTSPEKQEEESVQDRNWKKFREQRELERKEKEEALKRAQAKEQEAEALKRALEAVVNKPSQKQEYVEEELDEDTKIQRKVEAALQARERQYQEQRIQQEQQELPKRLTQTYNDFNQVCTQENLDYLEYHYPEVAAPYKHLPDSFDKWSAVYKAVKRFVPNPESKKEQAKAEKNFSKPKAMASPGATHTGDSAPQYLDEAKKRSNYARMQKIMKGGNP